jgi:UDP-N-acetyl-D-mannosaminuronate dehydrogenase
LEHSFVHPIKLGILGLTYKENTNSLKNSASIKFLKSVDSNLNVLVFDPMVKVMENSIMYGKTAQSVIDNTNVIAIMTPWDEFKVLDYTQFQGVILDPYDTVKNSSKNAKIYTLGKIKC